MPYQRCISWRELLLNKASNKIQIYEYSVEFSTSTEGSDEEEAIYAYYHHFIQFGEHRDRLKQYAQIKQFILSIWSCCIENFSHGICSEGWK